MSSVLSSSAVPTLAAGPLFAPPAAAQRYALVASLAVAAGAKTVLDLGCGDGKLIQVCQQGRAGSIACVSYMQPC
jgi:cyclopropane fatty-acyl-phospholipid synthase-like methyltransferase